MGVRLDVFDGSDLGIDIPGSTWGEFWTAAFSAIYGKGPGFASIIEVDDVGFLRNEPPKFMGEYAEEMEKVAALLPDGPDFAEGAHRALALRIAKLAKAASAAGKGLVWS